MHTLFKTNRLFLALFTALALGVAGCGDDDDGDKGTGPHGDSTPISADNAASVNTQVGSTLGTVFGKGPGTHKGAVSGEVVVTQNIGKPAQTVSFSFDMAFDNYSDDGKLIYDGTIEYQVNGTDFFYEIDMVFSGDYAGAVTGQVSGNPNGFSGSWVVNGQTIVIQ